MYLMQKDYHSIIASLLYFAAKTRPDLYVAAGILGSYVAGASEAHYVAAKCVLKYIKSIMGAELKLHQGTSDHLLAFVDSIWEANPTQVVEVDLECLVVI